jgi:hypothetical protein
MTNFQHKLNQIFYGYKKFDDPCEICKIFSPFFFQTPAQKPPTIHKEPPTIQKSIQQNDFLHEITEPTRPKPARSNPEWFQTNYTDTLFWCIFRHVYGEFEYMNIGSRYGNRMLEEKQKIMEHFLKTPKHLKEYSNIKFTNARIQETCSEFLCDKKTSPIVLAAYAVYYGINIYVVDDEKHTYIEFRCLSENEEKSEKSPCWIYKNKMNTRSESQYKLCLTAEKSEEDIQITHCGLEQFDKPLLGISHYKLQDLENLEKKLQINASSSDPKNTKTNKNTKIERYEHISKQMTWEW